MCQGRACRPHLDEYFCHLFFSKNNQKIVPSPQSVRSQRQLEMGGFQGEFLVRSRCLEGSGAGGGLRDNLARKTAENPIRKPPTDPAGHLRDGPYRVPYVR